MASSSTAGQHQIEVCNAFDGIAPQPSEPSPTVTRKPPYDVFINHRGRDVKHKLASTIYHTLELVGFRAFLDQEELELGDSIPTELQEAIRRASLHIAIFSENYAQSPWCLAELSFMVKTGTPIIPVFYHVEPDDLRWVAQGKGIYANAFSRHVEKNRYTSEMLQEWKTALQDVSYMSGYMLISDNDDEGRILKSIVNSVLKVVKKEPLEVAKYPVAMDEIVQGFERDTLQCPESEQHVQIAGIVGFGGAGKTTLAKEVYNRKCSSINRSSFLFNVRDAAAGNALHNKQKRLLEDLRVQSESFDNIEQGKAVLSNRLRSLCVLIVLDDVDQQDRLDALLPPKDSLGPGSLIIVTTREGSILANAGITSVYRMRALHHSYAKQLFCWQTFLRPSPLEGFEDLVEKFLIVCNGLPLSLKVIGAQLYGRNSKDYWESQLHKIQRILPKHIKDKLKISYEALDEDEQEMFLDVACFFIGEKKSLAIAVWDGSGWSGLCSWETLFNKCLVELDEEDCIRMHDHLRDLGREIAMTHSPSRLFSPKQSTHIQQGMLLRGWWIRDCSLYFKPPLKEYTEMMKNSSPTAGLKLLVLRQNDFTQEFAEASTDLVWLRWFHFEHRNLPSWLSLEKLRVLELLQAKQLTELWEDEAKLPLQLRELVIQGGGRENACLQRLPKSIGHLKHLKKVSLIDSTSLSSLPEEFCLLESLEHLHLERCISLLSLPTHFGDLENLRHITSSFCEELRMLPGSCKQLKLLEYLNLYCCEKLALASGDLENMTKLKVLNVSDCKELQELPHHITNQASLKELNLDGTSSLRELPANIGQLIKLETLIIGSPLLTSLPTSLGNLSCLTNLIISSCLKLESLPQSMGPLDRLQHLSIKYSGVKAFPIEFGQLTSLQNLRKIDLWYAPVSRISLPGDSCPKIESFVVCKCDYLREIESLPAALKFIELSYCEMLKNIRAIGALRNLQSLQIFGCPELDEMPSLAGLASLKEFQITDSPKVEKLKGLEHLKSLETLKARTRWKAPGIESLEQMVSLRRLELVADNRLALRPCIKIEKWPYEMIVCGRAADNVCTTLDSFTFPGLSVINLVMEGPCQDFKKLQIYWRLSCPEIKMSNAAIICFIIHSDGSIRDDWVGINLGKLQFRKVFKKGTWVVIGVYTQGLGATAYPHRISTQSHAVKKYNPRHEVYKGILMVGLEDRVVQVFSQLFDLLEG